MKTKDFFWFSGGNLIYLLCQWLLSFLIVWLSGYQDAGVLSLAMAVTNVYDSIARFGMRNYQVSDIRDETPPGVYVASRILTIGGAFLGLICYVFLNQYDSEITKALLLYGLFRTTEAAVDVFHGMDQKNGRLDAVGKSFTARGMLFLVAFSATLYLGGSLNMAIISMFVVTALVVLFYDFPVAQKVSPFKLQWQGSQLRRLLLACFPLLISGLLATVMGTVPRVSLERLWGSEMLGYFTSVTTPTLIVQVAASYLYSPLIPAFSYTLEEGDYKQFLKRTAKIGGLIAILAVAALIVGIILGEWGLVLLFGESIRPYTYLLRPAIICTIMTAYVWFLNMLLTVMRDGKGLVIANLAALIACLISAIPMIQFYSAQGANYCNMLGLGVTLSISLWRFFVNIKQIE